MFTDIIGAISGKTKEAEKEEGEGLLHEQMEHWCLAGEIRGKGGAHQNTERCSGGTTDSWLAGWLAAELWTDSSNSR